MFELISGTEEELHFCNQLSSQSDDSTITKSQFNQYLASNGLLVIKLNGELVGFIAYRVILDVAELDQIIVSHEYQGKGVGSKALDVWHALLTTRSVASVFLEVRVDNIAAVKAYRKAGYVEVGLRKNYYSIKDQLSDALVMEHQLSSKSA
jgi:ribosomal-protein-alanine N-acetyltransferase